MNCWTKPILRPRCSAWPPLSALPTPAEAGVGDLLVAPTRIVLDGRKGAEIILNNIGDEPATYRISVEFRRMTADGSLVDVAEPTAAGESRRGHDRLCAAPGDAGAARAAGDPHRRAAAAGPARRRISRPHAVSRDPAGDAGRSGRRRGAQGPAVPADPDLRRDHPGHRPPRQSPGDRRHRQRPSREEGRQADGRRSTSAARARARPSARSGCSRPGVKDPIARPEGGRGLHRGRRAPRRDPDRRGVQGRRRRARSRSNMSKPTTTASQMLAETQAVLR